MLFLISFRAFSVVFVIGTGKSVHWQSFPVLAAIEIYIIRKHIHILSITDGINIFKKREKECHLIGKQRIPLFQEILFYRSIRMYRNIQFLPYLHHIFWAEQIYFLAPEGIGNWRLYLPFLDPARNRSCTDAILSRSYSYLR